MKKFMKTNGRVFLGLFMMSVGAGYAAGEAYKQGVRDASEQIADQTGLNIEVS